MVKRTALGGKDNGAQGAATAAPLRPEQDPNEELPADLRRIMAQAGVVAGAPAAPEPSASEGSGQVSRETNNDDAGAADGERMYVSTHLANQGDPNQLAPKQAAGRTPRSARQQPAAPQGMQVSLASLLTTTPKTPEEDLYRPGWQYPRYIYAVIRVLAFQRRADMQLIASELMYCALTGQEPSGPLRGIPQAQLAKLLEASYAEHERALGMAGE